jgi:hypothetical protein
MRRAGLAALIVASTAGAAAAEPANTLNELWTTLAACWIWPAAEDVVEGMQITVLFTLNRDGKVFGEPRFTYSKPGVAPQALAAYRRAAAESLLRCTPVAITPELGNAIAGRPIAYPMREPRNNQRKT